jgi:hypothetical protein
VFSYIRTDCPNTRPHDDSASLLSAPILCRGGCFDYKYKLKRNSFFNFLQGTARPIEQRDL